MLTMPCHRGHRCFPLLLAVLLSACATRSELHEFPPELALPARPSVAVNYTLEMDEDTPENWELRGGQGAVIGSFTWQPGEADSKEQAQDHGVDFGREDRVIDSVNGNVYSMRVGAINSRMRNSSARGMAPPRVRVIDTMSEQRIGDLELKTGYEHRIEGVWRDQSVLWQLEIVPARRATRKSEDGEVEDIYPASQVLSWTGGSDAGVRIYAGRRVTQDDGAEAFGAPFFDVVAERPLTRRELGDAIVQLFAIRSSQEAAELVNFSER